MLLRELRSREAHGSRGARTRRVVLRDHRQWVDAPSHADGVGELVAALENALSECTHPHAQPHPSTHPPTSSAEHQTAPPAPPVATQNPRSVSALRGIRSFGLSRYSLSFSGRSSAQNPAQSNPTPQERIMQYSGAVRSAVRGIYARFGPNAGGAQNGIDNTLSAKDRQFFVAFGGPSALMRVLSPPVCPATPHELRYMSAERFQPLVEVLNYALVLIRELSFTVPGLASQVFTPSLGRLIFALMAHRDTFDNASYLLEELLSAQRECLDLRVVPDLNTLVRGFSFRQLACFCRVLALLVFEPEDRKLLEAPHAMKSLELLQLRRDRMAHASPLIDRNQALILSIPDLFARLLLLLHTMNHAPALHELSMFHVTAQHHLVENITAFAALGHNTGWDALQTTLDIAGPPSVAPYTPATPSTPGENGGGVADGGNANTMNDIDDDDDDDDDASATAAAASNTVQYMLRTLAPLIRNSVAQRQDGTAASTQDAAMAASQMKILGLYLAPNQVEVLFVICTLLGSRRKLNVQRTLRACRLEDSMITLFERLSWGSPPPRGPNPLEQIHGPGCECNPESALRVQFLRIVHNYIDADIERNSQKELMLSPQEHTVLRAMGTGAARDMVLPRVDVRDANAGLLCRIIRVLMSEPRDSIYRFWLASCVESFLRGAAASEKVLVVQTGLMAHLVNEVANLDGDPKGSLQTTFDLLGELCKGNLAAMVKLEELLAEDERFNQFMHVVQTHLVDSNVFVRSIMWTFERAQQDPPSRRSTFMSHSWRRPRVWSLSVGAAGAGAFEEAEADRRIEAEPTPASAMDADIFADRRGADGGLARVGRLRKRFAEAKPLFLIELMRIVNLKSITHENICCLNTAIILCIYLHRAGALADALASLPEAMVNMGSSWRQADDSGASTDSASIGTAGALRRNFRELLWFWQQYYTNRGRDRLSLEFSSRIPYDEWFAVVSALTADDLSTTALVSCPVLLPTTPYVRSPFLSSSRWD